MKCCDAAILLTACVSPSGMVLTAVQDPVVRKQQYIEAIKYYLYQTSAPVVFCENTGCDFSYLFQSFIDTGRFEYITFVGNDYDKRLGKGYGESLIILKALEESVILKKYKYIVKITGRLIVRNIKSIVHSSWFFFQNVIRCDFSPYTQIKSQCIVVDKSLINDILYQGKEKINDSNGVYFEHIVYEGILNHKEGLVIPFFKPIDILGISGSTGAPYSKIDSIEGMKTNCLLTAVLYRRRHQLLRCAIFTILYKLILLKSH